MTIFARKLAHQADWADGEEFWERNEQPLFMLREAHDGFTRGGMSVFAIPREDRETLKSLGAALYVKSTTHNLADSMYFRFIDSQFLSDRGIEFDKTEGDLQNSQLNLLHYDVRLRSVEQAFEVLSHMRGPEEKLSRVDIMGKLAIDAANGLFLSKDLKKEHIKHFFDQKYWKLGTNLLP